MSRSRVFMATNKKGEPNTWDRIFMPSVRKLFLAAFVFIVVMNFMAWGVENNGGAYSGNFVWELVGAYLALQSFLIGAAIIGFVAFIGFKLFPHKSCKNEYIQEQALNIRPSGNAIATTPLKTSEATATDIETPKAKQLEVAKPPLKQVKELSKEDIRKRVLEELTGRSE